MTNVQKITIRLSSARQKINELLSVEERTSDQNVELETLTAEIQTTEPELRAAIASEGADETVETTAKPEDRELRSLIGKASVGTIISSALRNKSTSGPERELQDHLEIATNEIPLDLLRTPVEHRAVTVAPSNVGSQQAEIVQPVFSSGDAAFLGVRETLLAAGDAIFPVLSNRATVHGPYKDSTVAANTTGVFTADALAPSRIQATFLYRRTDSVRFTSMDDALRMALSSGLQEALNKELIDQIVSDVGRTDASAADTFATYRARCVYAQVDGRFTNSEADIRLLVGPATLQDMAVLYRGNNADDSAVDSIRRVSGGLRVSPNIAAVAATKQDVLIRKGANDDAHVGLWPGIAIIDDQVTAASKGEVNLTAILLAAWKVTRPAGFARVQSQHS